MSTAKSIVIVGAGHMGSALALGLGLKRSHPNTAILAVEPDALRCNDVSAAGIPTVERLPEIITADIVILATPPQVFYRLSKDNPQLMQYAGILISVMAGITLSTLATCLKNNQICRAIPNLPCAINKGATAFITSTQTTLENNRLISTLFSRLGTCIRVEDESLIDDATALIGGGPAYVSYFAAALIEYAVSSGFDRSSASSLVVQILHGSTGLMEIHQETPIKLCKKVMTSGGTTERAISHLNKKQVHDIFIEALKQSSARSKELGQEGL